ncbi:hypothetical protein [Parasphingorhabdus sp.]|uniref:hypothetical protein n=1 Tax=Parasphingorhabdus sp. TaxID=2709688 RepID=UPI003C7918EF
MRLLAAIGITLLLAGCAGGGDRLNDRERYNRAAGKPIANPSAVVKAELSFARLAQEKGQWTAFRETAADDAIMFVPNITNAQQWLKGKADPPQAVEWQPHKISMSCDGSLAVSTGAWQDADGGTGSFVTIWRLDNFDERHRGKDQDWKWVFDHGTPLDEPLPAPDFIETEVAACTGDAIEGYRNRIAQSKSTDRRRGNSRDGTLVWEATQYLDDMPAIKILVWNGEKMEPVAHDLKMGDNR